MIEVRKTAEFASWFKSLRDIRARARIEIRIARIEIGNFGDTKFFDGIGEIRISYGPGYRVYFTRRGDTVVLLLCGGDKSSQRKDVRKAIAMARELD
ncbi:type II toxin-antitoxin system RelE/ParE family toxin [Nitratireductor pacificus]|uniref:Addiction module killer protein n=1 Tax=Nitratireductor pacificus pht-3B TaxID=391937 RepID=K2LRI6_9HYPH|nr:type II toxin-antitoxin system RelE/ParE family toxin [Nitratireductor pacificus]EKF20379.1 hypothetical protein NA2_03957 [Nitratireductor pacificus pht-3B]